MYDSLEEKTTVKQLYLNEQVTASSAYSCLFGFLIYFGLFLLTQKLMVASGFIAVAKLNNKQHISGMDPANLVRGFRAPQAREY